jgi:uncharacterized protein (TIGR03067 family)
MKLIFSTLLITALIGATTLARGESQKDDTGQEQKRDLQGSWAITGTKGYGKDAQKDFQGLVITFAGDKIAAKYDGKSAQASYKLILTKAGPSQVDVTVNEGPDAVKGKTFNCIYLLEGNTLKITYREPGKQRPSTFTDEGDAGVYTVSFKKQKQ